MAPQMRAIRAHYDDQYITVYQAYNHEIASAAVEHQKLSASPSFRPGRMTWVKPSWCWMMYRCGYSYKDANQERVLALRMTHENFSTLLRDAVLAHSEHQRGEATVVQWDPERGPRLERLQYRSIQIGIPGAVGRWWVEEGINSIADVTEMARGMKAAVDGNGELGVDELVKLGHMPVERVYLVDDEIAAKLGMD